MQLKKIKLAGFKSFVDPTVVLVPSKLVAVVGPNGCGKSNIIDAVSWVMGESSAKYLRGESLTDVIFNGSTARKPVGQASVELIFDNQDGGIGGEFSAYSEISIRRVITRDSDSSYFLNGTRCRRRDIIDIFLGTGLGPRSYSIIGQNMISRIIEAKPDDMRIYLEEAAGVSKYKERRRETENRINHTKENLDRLNDVRTELDKQLNVLKRQANAAEKFKILKQEERTFKAELLALQWRQLDGRLVQAALQVQQQETALEARHSEMSDLNLKIDAQRESQRVATESFQDVQRRYYAIGNEISRIEQEIRHTKTRQQQLNNDLQQVSNDYQETNTTLDTLGFEQAELQTEIRELEPTLENSNAIVADFSKDVARLEDSLQGWQTRSDHFQQHFSKLTQTAQVEQTRIQHLEQRITTIDQQKSKLTKEKSEVHQVISELEKELNILDQNVLEANKRTQEQDGELQKIREKISTLQTRRADASAKLEPLRKELQRLQGQQSSLEALQQTALGQRNNRVVQWLSKHQLDKKLRLAEGVEVESGWENALEKVLGYHLQAICVENLRDVSQVISDLKEGNLCVFATGSNSPSVVTPNMLMSKVKSSWSLEGLLAGIYVAETREEALSLSQSLKSHESVITKEGEWFGQTWIRITREENIETGVFQRSQDLKQLTKQIESCSKEVKALEGQISEDTHQLQNLESDREALQKTAHEVHAKSAELIARQKIQTQRLAELKKRIERFDQDEVQQSTQLNESHSQLMTARDTWQRAMSELEQQAMLRENLAAEREILRTDLSQAKEKLFSAQKEVQEQHIRLQTVKSQIAGLSQNLSRLQSQLKTLDERKKTIEQDINAIPPLENLEKTLDTALTDRLHIEETLHSARSELESIEQTLRQFELRRQEVEREVVKYRDIVETLRVESQGLKVRAETVVEQLVETGFTLETILKDLSEEKTIEEAESLFQQTTQRIARLGPINLVAIEEYTSCAERKEYLDKQYNDLQEGLATLENAIAKIDKETRAKFKETFEKVNTCFQELFPKIFGGGRAYLELTGENLLDAGITVMACPPGKRNSTIHLLSGGEKAMTAIALVFSIFHLNPAPFCLLDEVDAPLDDANIGRFCELVKAMTDKTQFIFISHNKLAIEMAEHLMGVTMHEPGVSRLVSVNVEEAVTLAGA